MSSGLGGVPDFAPNRSASSSSSGDFVVAVTAGFDASGGAGGGCSVGRSDVVGGCVVGGSSVVEGGGGVDDASVAVGGGGVDGALVVGGGVVTVSLSVVGLSVISGTTVLNGGTVIVATVVGKDVGNTLISVDSTVGVGIIFTVDKMVSVGAYFFVTGFGFGEVVGGSLLSNVVRAPSAWSSVAFRNPDEGLGVVGVKPPIVRPILRLCNVALAAAMREPSSSEAAILSSTQETNSWFTGAGTSVTAASHTLPFGFVSFLTTRRPPFTLVLNNASFSSRHPSLLSNNVTERLPV